jgi:hypothetical protein
MAHCTLPARRNAHLYRAYKSWISSPIFLSRLSTDIFWVPISQTINPLIISLMETARGPTRPETRISEADSYVHLSQVHNYWGLLSSRLQERVVVERRSLDSFHNLLFSLTKFYEATGFWPEHVTIISNEFKRARFLELHCKALDWPADRVTFVGIDPEYMSRDLERAVSVRDGERRNGFDPWQRDMLGWGEELEAKRKRRNPWLVKQTLFESDDIRGKSGVHYSVLDHREVLDGKPQPWGK